MTSIDDRKLPGTAGLRLHKAALYDFGVWLMLLGRERAFRDRMLLPARLMPGESVLDIGCGTGGVAMAAKRQVGPAGRVIGIDASAEMVARARKKAGKAGLDVFFIQAAAQALPFPSAQLDIVSSTLMLHHLPRNGRQQCAREMQRLLKPGGRALVVDFAAPARPRWSLLRHFHRHGHVKLEDIVAVLDAAGLTVTNSGVLSRSLSFALATKSKAE